MERLMARHSFCNRLGQPIEIPEVAASQAKNSEGLLELLQTPAAKSGLEAAFNATPAELGQAAVEAARRRR
jgi:hypothetical protein